eukprot:284815578_5
MQECTNEHVSMPDRRIRSISPLDNIITVRWIVLADIPSISKAKRDPGKHPKTRKSCAHSHAHREPWRHCHISSRTVTQHHRVWQQSSSQQPANQKLQHPQQRFRKRHEEKTLTQR